MVEARGPIYAAGFQQVTTNGYSLLYLPDIANDELQRAGKAPVYWWLPNTVRLAQKANGDYKFRFLHFVGIRSEGTHVGVSGREEVSGGLLGFSTTTAPPPEVLKASEEELLNRFRGNDDHYWGWRTPVAPMFRPAPIVSNTTTITNLSPGVDGTVPTVQPAGGGAPAPGGLGAAPPGSLSSGANRSRPPLITAGSANATAALPRSVPRGPAMRGSNLDPWFVNLGGQGPGAVNPFAENAYSGLVGSIPAAIIWGGFHGGDSGFAVWQNLRMRVWSPAVHLLIEGDWDRIQNHFSAAAHAGWWWWSGDIKAEFNNLVADGTITSKIEVDTTIPGAEKMQAELEKRKDLVFQKFMDQAQKTIFDPAPFSEKPAEASGGFLGWGGGFAVKLRQDRTHLHLRYEETTEFAYIQEYPISGTLTGLQDAIAANPDNEKKYFSTVYLDDWERKVSRTVKPVVNWPDPARDWVGEPVAFLSCQIGYPNSAGVVQWDSHIFHPVDGADAYWSTATAMKAVGDVANPPAGWTPDKAFIKRQIHFLEPPNELDDPYSRISVEREIVDLDPGELGTLSNVINNEVRVDSAGVLAVGPIELDADLENSKQVIEVTFQADGRTLAGHPRNAASLSWKFDDYTKPRYWMIYTGDLDYSPKFTYQVRVIVKGSIFSHGIEWTGPKNEVKRNGPLMLSVPTQEDAISTRSLPRFGMDDTAPGAVDRPPATTGVDRPPAASPARSGPPDVTFSGWSSRPPVPSPAASRSRSGPKAGSKPRSAAYPTGNGLPDVVEFEGYGHERPRH